MLGPVACDDVGHVVATLMLLALGFAANAMLVLRPLYRARMAAGRPVHTSTTSLCLLLLSICLLSDSLLHHRVLERLAHLYGLMDNAAHATIALLSWALTCTVAFPRHSLRPLEGVAALFTGSLLDLDHFIVAAGWSFRAATSLSERPFGHAVVFVAALALLTWWTCPVARRVRAVAFVLACLLSHHLRDSYRRGLWIAPVVGSTPPVPYPIYLVLEVLLPTSLAFWWRWMERRPHTRPEPALVV
ncbi:hypothetical protein SPRG_00100 [Saprolegnia parasitica CBS 223.65]|uniref:Transmembrane protein 267 n=1 Tax=Saprolegnia parasitica (strain CBS 223.65) TaxID=695850 RepID=A0A067CX45_SAPPC|nr:hypothetical protein SPRG_00100 [Saprolegnia parasitica CBS 223.65]KDO35254.1 hypothetical protein SPRG_00100 [Saprolegnia parasitica CBS 223.65]|eukprot:XP_012193605.1 hypothetical protein SPRG_00100 [Saprolegnia parasitica CBS 223.65]